MSTLQISYKLLTYEDKGRPVAGVLVADEVFDISGLLGAGAPNSILALLERWDRFEPELEEIVRGGRLVWGEPLDQTRLLAPVLYPNAIYCAAANYRDHMHAMALKLNQPDEPDPRERDIKPYHFVVPGRSGLAGPADPIRMPAHGANLDWEIELVAVIGKPAHRVSPERALEHVAAYAIGNDVSVRDMRYLKIPNVPDASLFRTDFIGMKCFDGGCTIGPWLTPARDVADPQRLAMQLWINGETMQDSSTAEMIFTVAEQVAYLSERVTLLPGDLVMTGTPAGTGMEQDRFLQAGETVRVAIEGLGEMSQRVISAGGGAPGR